MPADQLMRRDERVPLSAQSADRDPARFTRSSAFGRTRDPGRRLSLAVGPRAYPGLRAVRIEPQGAPRATLPRPPHLTRRRIRMATLTDHPRRRVAAVSIEGDLREVGPA
jgi:hypothetical protein